MTKLLKQLSGLVYKQFKIFWLLISTILLAITLYFSWQMSMNRSLEDLSKVASNLSNKADGFIEDLFQEVYTLPVYGEKFTDCKNELYPYLQRILLNNNKISGISISDSNYKLICSTLPTDTRLINTTGIKARTILGPFRLAEFDQPVYLVQQKMGNYQIGIVVVASELERLLQTPIIGASSVALHNQFEKKNIVRIEPNKNQFNWQHSDNLQGKTPLNSDLMFAMDKLQSIDGVIVVVFENHNTILKNIWVREFLVALIFLISSYFLYYLIKNMLERRYSLNGSLKSAIKNEEFFPAYQPLYDHHLGGFSGVEVLLRWRDKQDKIIMPDLFVGEAESTGLIVPITLQIIHIAFIESAHILASNPNFHLSFNLTAQHFADPNFFNKFDELLDRFKIPPHQIIFEITERNLLDINDSIYSKKMLALRDAGFSLAVDDYGTGHASISYLQNFPFNYLKIDKLFVQAIGTKAITESLNDAIINMAKGLNLNIIAEGVETKEQVSYLTENGVRFLQGWYYSKALSIEKLIDLLNREQQ